jgi:hypothetical protein
VTQPSPNYLGTCWLVASVACGDPDAAPPLDDVCGSYTVETEAELAELTHCRTIAELYVGGDEITEVILPKLEEAGTLDVTSTSLQEVELPVLSHAGSLFVNSPALVRIELPALVEAYDLWLESADGPDLPISLPQLTTVSHVSLFGDALTTLDAPRLQTVEHDAHLRNSIASLSLPRLATIGGALILSTPELVGLELPVLEALGALELNGVGLTSLALTVPTLDRLFVQDCPALASLDLPDLVQAGDVTIAGSTSLERVLLPQLSAAGRILLDTNPELTSFSADALVRADNLDVLRNPALEELSLPSLLEIPLSSELLADGVGVSDNAGLKAVSLPSLLRAPSFDLYGNPSLSRLDLDALSESGDSEFGGVGYGGVYLEDCPALTELALPSLRTRGVYVRANASLAAVRAPLLESNFVTILESPVVHTVELDALREGEVEVGACVIAELSLPSFESGRLSVGVGPSLTSLSAPAFAEGQVSIADAPATLSFPSLESSPRIEVLQSERLESLSLPALLGAHELRLSGCPALVSTSLPQLSTLGGLDLNGTGLASVSLPQLDSWLGSLQLTNNPSLANLDFAGFTLPSPACNVYVAGNPSLPTCEVQAVLDAALAEGVTCSADIADTDDAAVCL